MYRKRMLLIALVISVVMFALLIAFHWNSPGWHFRSHSLIKDAAFAIALALGILGNQELDRGGHRTARRITRNLLVIWIAISLLLFGITRVLKTTGFDLALDCLMYLLWVLFASILPFALYLNRKQNNSTPQQESANES